MYTGFHIRVSEAQTLRSRAKDAVSDAQSWVSRRLMLPATHC